MHEKNEKISKEIQVIKKMKTKPEILEPKDTVTELNNSKEIFNNRFDQAEESVN